MTRGGVRPGAGHKKGSGLYGEETKVMRIPASMTDDVLKFVAEKGYRLPLYTSKVQAGFPSPADEHFDKKMDLNEYLIRHPSSTFFVRATGESMINAGINEDDILVVDRSITATDGKIVIAAVDGQLTVKRLRSIKGKAYLHPENDAFKPIEITEANDTVIWGVVTSVVKKF